MYKRQVYASLLKEPDYRLAGLHNNLSLLYAETGRLSEAEKRGLKAVSYTHLAKSMNTNLSPNSELHQSIVRVPDVAQVPDIWLDQARQFQQVMMHYTCAIRRCV